MSSAGKSYCFETMCYLVESRSGMACFKPTKSCGVFSGVFLHVISRYLTLILCWTVFHFKIKSELILSWPFGAWGRKVASFRAIYKARLPLWLRKKTTRCSLNNTVNYPETI